MRGPATRGLDRVRATGMARMVAVLRRYAFTLAMLLLLALTAGLTGSHAAPLAGEWRDGLGFAPRDLRNLDWVKLITSALVTHGGWTFWRAMAMVALFVGAAERTVRSRFTAATFWGVRCCRSGRDRAGPSAARDQATPPSFAEGLLPLPARRRPFGGLFRLLGPRVACLRSGVARSPATVGVVAALIAALFLPPLAEVAWEVDLLADAGHCAGFVAGSIVGCRYGSVLLISRVSRSKVCNGTRS